MEMGDLAGIRRVREGIDKPRLEALVADTGGDWYRKLVGDDGYRKLRDLWVRHLKKIVICPRSKR